MSIEEKNRVFNSGDFKSLSDSQRRIFRQVVEDLDERGIFRPTDVAIIASYARNVILARLASKELAVDILQKAQISMEKTAALLGLTPTGRKRLKDEQNIKTASEAWDEQGD